MASNGTPQGQLYGTGYGNLTNTYRDRSAEQSSSGSGNPMLPYFNTSATSPYSGNDMYNTAFLDNGAPSGGQRGNLGRYVPPMLDGTGNWNNSQGGYAYNLPTDFGPYQGSFGNGNGASDSNGQQAGWMQQLMQMYQQLMPQFGGQSVGGPGAGGGLAPNPNANQQPDRMPAGQNPWGRAVAPPANPGAAQPAQGAAPVGRIPMPGRGGAPMPQIQQPGQGAVPGRIPMPGRGGAIPGAVAKPAVLSAAPPGSAGNQQPSPDLPWFRAAQLGV